MGHKNKNKTKREQANTTWVIDKMQQQWQCNLIFLFIFENKKGGGGGGGGEWGGGGPICEGHFESVGIQTSFSVLGFGVSWLKRLRIIALTPLLWAYEPTLPLYSLIVELIHGGHAPHNVIRRGINDGASFQW